MWEKLICNTAVVAAGLVRASTAIRRDTEKALV